MGFMRGEGGSGGGGGGVPTLTASRAVVTNGSGALAAATTTAAEVGYLNGVTSAVQTQLDGKAATSHSHAIGDVTNLQTTLDGKQASNDNLTALAGLTGAADRVPYFTALATLALAVLTSFGRSLIAAADAAGVRSLLGLGTAAQSNTGDFAAASHTHAAADISDSTSAGRAVLTAADAAAQRTSLGLGAADVVTFEKLIARQDGGVAGTDDVEVYHDGTDAYLHTKSGNLGLRSTGAFYFVRNSDGAILATLNNVSDLILNFGRLYLSSNGTNGFQRQSDDVTKVIGSEDALRDLSMRHLLTSDFLRLASPVNNQTDALTDITGLAQTLTAGKKYAGRLALLVTSATPAEGMKLDFGGTATFTQVFAALTGNVQGATVVTSRFAGSGAIELSAFSDADPHWLLFDVTVDVNAGGTLVPRWAKTADGDDLTINHGSYFDLREVR